MTAAKLDLVYKVWDAGSGNWRYEVRPRASVDSKSAVVTTTGCAASEELAANAARLVIAVEHRKHDAEWRDE